MRREKGWAGAICRYCGSGELDTLGLEVQPLQAQAEVPLQGLEQDLRGWRWLPGRRLPPEAICAA